MKPIVNAVTILARKAGKIILQAQNDLSSIKITKKSNNTFMSNIDVAVEDFLVDNIKKLGFDDYFITEEAGEFGNKESKFTWIIDPIDGTNNFIHGLPHCCISIALKKDDELVLGVIYNPFLDLMFSAYKGQGAQLNGKKIRVAQSKELDNTLISASLKYSRKIFNDSYVAELIKLQQQIAGYRYSGSIAMDMAYLAAGYIDGLWACGSVKLWDIAAGYVIAKEAGAIVTDIKGISDIDNLEVIVAGNKKIQPKLIKLLAKHVK
ncbi:inositol monophosphatase [Allofrancisella guangzhouensis]|uniref:Inositol-1-monophosphatase n=1 Tax=Allofrancisella guangzhouensis TaxID=594679 RepID=A0A0A8E498_9GAMM|nr:inositol monophosphatase family protein [Allofrancisella guangzhouensis]AJC48779.1 inositol monophosphatase [Allofrancisella guangzhouensis]MBK2027999.1 inositol monophosphatase [Allofrancisella guangzhouensis]MBK2044419.1 inositol monophosphatase [Allofrancisella guangzhouensis]MBK2045275.1 inositol monophosphatase [Allofrancisella guangzhouensis]